MLQLNPPITNVRPVEQYLEIPATTVAANQTNYVLFSFALVASLSLLRVRVGARDSVNLDVGSYDLTATVRNLPGRAVAATQVLTSTGTFANNETVVIGGKTYTFQTTLTNVDGNVLIGANAAASIANLAAAITLGAGAGTTYAAAMTAHPTVTVSASNATTLTVQAKTKGTPGNSIATTETVVNASWGAATLAGGIDAVALVGSVDQVVAEDDSAWNATVGVNATTGLVEVRVTSDGTNPTFFDGFVQATVLQS